MWVLTYTYNQFFGREGIEIYQIKDVSGGDIKAAAKVAYEHLRDIEKEIKKNPVPNHGKASYHSFSLEWQELFEENFNKIKSRLKELSK